MEFTAQQIAGFLKGNVIGDPDTKVNNFSKIEEGKSGTITFLANPKYEHYIYDTKASIVLVNNDFVPSATITATLIKVPDAYSSLAVLLNMAEQSKTKKTGIDTSALISKTASIGNDCYIGAFSYIGENVILGKDCMIYPYAYIGDHVEIGDNTTIYPHVTAYENCIIGNKCIIHSGAVIGSDGFGFAQENGAYKKIAQLGNVILEDGVEVGANTTIDRAVIGSTIIQKGVKLDNLIQIAHNVEIGSNTAIAAQTGVAGSTKIGPDCVVGGQVGLGGHISIGSQTKIGGQSGVISNIEPNSQIMGSFAMPVKEFMRSNVIIKKLPEMDSTINKLQKEIEELKKKIKNKHA